MVTANQKFNRILNGFAGKWVLLLHSKSRRGWRQPGSPVLGVFSRPPVLWLDMPEKVTEQIAK